MGSGAHVRSFSFQQDNSKSKPNEDAHSCIESEDNYFFAVADGVSRSVYGDTRYPSSALPAAEAFCKVVVPELVLGVSIHGSFGSANNEIAMVNQRAGITSETVDYLNNDYLCCECVAGSLSKEYPKKFSYGYIGDCGILAYDRDLMPLFLSDNPMGIAEQFRAGFDFKDKSEQRIFWRKQLRNHSDRRYMTYGALTGEASALSYLKVGSIDLEPGDTVIIFSDGIYPFIFDVWFRHLVVFLLQTRCNQKMIDGLLGTHIMRTCLKLQQQRVGNLDDDKTLIALTVS